MKKFIIMSVLLWTFLIPILAAMREGDLRRTIRLVQTRFFWSFVAYIITILYILPRL